MGLNMAAMGFGNKLAGMLGEQAQQYGDLFIFTSIAVIWSLIGLLVIALMRPLNRLAHGAEDLG